MAEGIIVKCSKCNFGYTLFEDIHGVDKKINTIVGVCPACGNVEGFFFKHEFTFDYNAGDGKDGVPAKLDGEKTYDWDWLTYKKGAQSPNAKRDFDQDVDVINANIGFED